MDQYICVSICPVQEDWIGTDGWLFTDRHAEHDDLVLRWQTIDELHHRLDIVCRQPLGDTAIQRVQRTGVGWHIHTSRIGEDISQRRQVGVVSDERTEIRSHAFTDGAGQQLGFIQRHFIIPAFKQAVGELQRTWPTVDVRWFVGIKGVEVARLELQERSQFAADAVVYSPLQPFLKVRTYDQMDDTRNHGRRHWIGDCTVAVEVTGSYNGTTRMQIATANFVV